MAELSIDITTVSDCEAVLHVVRGDGRVDVRIERDLPADSEINIDVDGESVTFRTLPRPDGELLSIVTTVNDVHFGETEAGRIDDLTDGPIRRSEPGAAPYPEVMNRAAVAEMGAIDPDAVVVKGDLSEDGRDEEWAAFEDCYRTPFGDRLHVVRGNHDAYRGQTHYAGHRRIDVDGLTIALLDTVIPMQTTGRFDAEAADWLESVAAETDRPVLAMGHHQQWIGSGDPTERRSPDYFGLAPDDSDRLDAVTSRHRSIIAYTAGHTHRHRRRAMTGSGRPSIEVGCTKDFPGTWAEHRVYEGGVMHLVHRIGSGAGSHRDASDAALRWSESCRGLYSDFGIDYGTYALGALHDRCFNIALRR